MDRRLAVRSGWWAVVGTVALLVAGCGGTPVADDVLLTNNCDVTVLASVLDDSEFATGMWLRDYLELAPGESQVFTRPNFDGSLVRIDVVLESDHQVSRFEDRRIGDLSTTVSDGGTVLFEVRVEGELCPVG